MCKNDNIYHINMINIINIINMTDESAVECAICLDNSTMNMTTTICGHTYHKECIDRWVKTNASCPTCRKSLKQIKTIPKFKKGQAVRYNSRKQAEFYQYIRTHPGARMPTVNLRIWADPYWSHYHNTWMYDYEYDWNSEGTACEHDLDAINLIS